MNWSCTTSKESVLFPRFLARGLGLDTFLATKEIPVSALLVLVLNEAATATGGGITCTTSASSSESEDSNCNEVSGARLEELETGLLALTPVAEVARSLESKLVTTGLFFVESFFLRIQREQVSCT